MCCGECSEANDHVEQLSKDNECIAEVIAKVLVLSNLRTNDYSINASYHDYSVDAESRFKNLKKLVFPIIATCNHVLINAAMDVYYKRIVFNVEVGVNRWSVITSGDRPSLPGVCYPKAPTARLIRRLHVRGNDTFVGRNWAICCPNQISVGAGS
jgi:hypothetical protein